MCKPWENEWHLFSILFLFLFVFWSSEFALLWAMRLTRSNLPTYLSIYLSVCLSVCLSIYLSIYLSFYLSVCLSVCLSSEGIDPPPREDRETKHYCPDLVWPLAVSIPVDVITIRPPLSRWVCLLLSLRTPLFCLRHTSLFETFFMKNILSS